MLNVNLIRRASTKTKTERGIYVKHFKNIPMADMELVLVRISNPVENKQASSCLTQHFSSNLSADFERFIHSLRRKIRV